MGEYAAANYSTENAEALTRRADKPICRFNDENRPCQKSGNNRGGVLASGRKRAVEPKKTSNTPSAGEEPRADWKKSLQISESGKESRKSPTPVVGRKPNEKCQAKSKTYESK
jgi:hypothetical protein